MGRGSGELMASWYRVLRFYPDMARGERINVAVIAFDTERVLFRALKDYSRVEEFSGESFEPLTDYYMPVEKMTPEWARAHESHYMSCLQLEQSCASLLTVDELLDDMSELMLVEPQS